jgi:hypothetical protein
MTYPASFAGLVRWLVVISVVPSVGMKCKFLEVLSSIERILELLHVASLHIVQQYGIEAAWRGVRETGEILLRGTDNALLLVRINAGRRTAEAGIAPQAHLNEYQRCSILHDQIDLAKTTAIVLHDQFQALLL